MTIGEAVAMMVREKLTGQKIPRVGMFFLRDFDRHWIDGNIGC